jgi:hypothetical protein
MKIFDSQVNLLVSFFGLFCFLFSVFKANLVHLRSSSQAKIN